MKQQLGVDLQLALEHETLERLPGEVAKLDGDAFAHLPIRRKDWAHVVLEVDQVPFKPVEPVVNLKQSKLQSRKMVAYKFHRNLVTPKMV